MRRSLKVQDLAPGKSPLAGLVQHVHHLAVHVELELIRSGVAHAHRDRSPFIARQLADSHSGIRRSPAMP